MNALNSLMNPAAVGQQFQQGFEQARARRQEQMTRNALTAYAQNPDDQQAFSVLAQNAPEFAIQERRRRDAELQDQLARMDAQTAAATKRRVSFLGQAALAVKNLPEAQRAQAWRSYAMQGEQMGLAGLGQYADAYSPQALDALLADAGMIEKALDAQRVKYQVIPQGGYLQGFDNMGRPLDAGSAGNIPPPPPGFQIEGGQQMSAPNMMNTPAPDLGANGMPQVITREQYQVLVSAKGKEATDAMMARNNIQVR